MTSRRGGDGWLWRPDHKDKYHGLGADKKNAAIQEARRIRRGHKREKLQQISRRRTRNEAKAMPVNSSCLDQDLVLCQTKTPRIGGFFFL